MARHRVPLSMTGGTLLALLLVTSVAPRDAAAAGAYIHIHISQKAVEVMPPSPLRDLLATPSYMAILEAGSMFPDSGYTPGRQYGETAHWPELQEPFLVHLRAKNGDDLQAPEALEEFVFLLGAMSHGLADQIWDYTVLHRGLEVNPQTGTSADELADYFIVVDHNVLLDTQAQGPYDDLSTVFAEVGEPYPAEEFRLGLAAMQSVIWLQRTMGRTRYLEAWNAFPWLGTHLYNEEAPGSIPHMAVPMGAFFEANWRRYLGTASMDEDLVVATIPEDGAVNHPVDASYNGEAYRRIGLVLGYGVRRNQVTPLISLEDAAGNPVPFDIRTAYGVQIATYLMIVPREPLAHDTSYTVTLAAGVENLWGEATTVPYSMSFRTMCAPEHLEDCPPLAPPFEVGEIPTEVPPLPDPGGDPPDAGGDVGAPDVGAPDVGADIAEPPADIAGPDTGAPDAGADIAAPDTGGEPGGGDDTGTGQPDVATGLPDVPPLDDPARPVAGGGGDGCSPASERAPAPWAFLLLALTGLAVRASRRQRR